MSGFAEELSAELMTSWRAGMCDGLEMAAKMAQAILDHGPTFDQAVALTGLRDALRQAGVEMAAQERTR